jgi:Fe-S-cluster containining protein
MSASKRCHRCARCCEYFCFEIDPPDTFEEFEDIRWYLCHEGVSVHIDEGDWFISIDNPCRMLGEDGRCTIYSERPLICSTYDPDSCDYTDEEYGYDEEFHTPEEIVRYARRKLGDAAYDQAKARAWAEVNDKKQD